MVREFKDWLVRVFGRLWEGGNVELNRRKSCFQVHVAELRVGLTSSLSAFQSSGIRCLPSHGHSRERACDAEKAGSGKTM